MLMLLLCECITVYMYSAAVLASSDSICVGARTNIILSEYGATIGIVTYEDIVDTMLFLLKSRFVSGQIIYVDGGRHMKGQVYE